MNALKGKVRKVESSPFVSLVEVESEGLLFSALSLETPATADHLVPGSEVELIFKETETLVALDLSGKISLRNRAKDPIVRIKANPLFTHVTFNHGGTEVTATITTASAEGMGLKEGMEAEWLVKTHEMNVRDLGGCCSGGAFK